MFFIASATSFATTKQRSFARKLTLTCSRPISRNDLQLRFESLREEMKYVRSMCMIGSSFVGEGQRFTLPSLVRSRRGALSELSISNQRPKSGKLNCAVSDQCGTRGTPTQ